MNELRTALTARHRLRLLTDNGLLRPIAEHRAVASSIFVNAAQSQICVDELRANALAPTFVEPAPQATV